MAIGLYVSSLSTHRDTDGNSLAWELTGLSGLCRTEASGERIVGSSIDSSMSPLLSDSTLNSSRVSATS